MVSHKTSVKSKDIKWQPRFGLFRFHADILEFEGGREVLEGKDYAKFGNFLSNSILSDGIVQAYVKFEDTTKSGTCSFIIRDNPETGAFLCAGLGGGGGAYSVRAWDGQKWHDIKLIGDFRAIEANRDYHLAVKINGSRVELSVDGILLLRTQVPTALPPATQVGLWCQSESKITVAKYSVESELPTAFVIMQFSEPFAELFTDVILPVCGEFGVLAVRADETYGPGLILADVINRIINSAIIIAEITPPNKNVFYELGYAHAVGKPTILICSRDQQLPFDISGFRTLFYENSIGGKGKIEADLRKHLQSIMSQWSPTRNGSNGDVSQSSST